MTHDNAGATNNKLNMILPQNIIPDADLMQLVDPSRATESGAIKKAKYWGKEIARRLSSPGDNISVGLWRYWVLDEAKHRQLFDVGDEIDLYWQKKLTAEEMATCKSSGCFEIRGSTFEEAFRNQLLNGE